MSRSIHPPTPEQLRSLLIAARNRAGLTQAQVAEKLNRPQSFVSKYESGERQLDVLEFIHVCESLGARPEELFSQLLSRGR